MIGYVRKFNNKGVWTIWYIVQNSNGKYVQKATFENETALNTYMKYLLEAKAKQKVR